MPDQRVQKIFAQIDPLNLDNTLDQFSHKLATAPLAYDPGTQWRYSPAVDVQARLAEKLSGMTFEDYVRAHVVDPLGMPTAPGRSRKRAIPVSPRPMPPDPAASSGARATPISAVSTSATAS